ncbi:MAG: hypothetical protein Q8P56_06750 [Candidatus Uhrbacteria bacterium]|nr:hypothetical protein [Candidatus Uhrbacteria bacterium]
MIQRYVTALLVFTFLLMGSAVSAQEESQSSQGSGTGTQPPLQQGAYQQPGQQPLQQGIYGQPPQKYNGDQGGMNFPKDMMFGPQNPMNQYGQPNQQMQGKQPMQPQQGQMGQQGGQQGEMMFGGLETSEGGVSCPGDLSVCSGMTQEEADKWEADQEKKMEEQQKKMDEQRFKQMKKGLSQFQKGVKRMKTAVTRIEKKLSKCGVGVPSELKQALTDGEAVVPKIQAAQNIDDLDTVMDEIQSSGDAMQEWGPRMGEFQRLCDMIRRADFEVKRIKRDVTRLEKKVKSQKKFDLSELLADIKNASSKLEATLVFVKSKSKTDPEEALDELESDFFDNLSDLAISQQGVEMALNVTKGLKGADREIKKYDGLVKSLKNKKKDTADLEELVADLKARRKEIADFLAKKKFDPDDLVSLIEEATDARSLVVSALEEFGVSRDFVPQFKQGQGVNFQLPQGFEMQQGPGPTSMQIGDGPLIQLNQGGQQDQDQQMMQ